MKLRFLIAGTFFSFICRAQNEYSLHMAVKVIDAEGKPVEFADMNLLLGNQMVKTAQTEDNGRVSMNIPLDNTYGIYIAKKGFTTRFIEVHAKLAKASKDYYMDDIVIRLRTKSYALSETIDNKYSDGKNNTEKNDDAGKISYSASKDAFEFVKKIYAVDYKAKLMLEKDSKNIPLAGQEVTLMSKEEKVLQKAKTTSAGEFSFKKLDADENYTIVVEKSDKLPAGAVVAIATPSGKVQKLVKNKFDLFLYELLPSELNKLSSIDEEDPMMKMKRIGASSEKEITISANIYFASASAELQPDAKKVIDEAVSALKQNQNLALEVASHTDSKGDDAYNLKLSEKRASAVVAYTVSKGIDPKRVSGKGYGETKILNRCTNGTDCSEEEHKENRRTEFKFIKK